MKNRETFLANEDGVEFELTVVQPSPKIQSEGDTIYAKAHKQFEKENFYLKAETIAIIKKRSLWDDDKQAELDKIERSIAEGLMKLRKGGITKLEGRKVAIGVIQDRNRRSNLLNILNTMDDMTCESKADNERFDYFVSQCVLKDADTGEKYFRSLEDYKSRKTEDAAALAAAKLASLIYDVVAIQTELPEYKFMLKFSYMNDKLQLTDSDTGKLCDIDFKPISDDGYYLNDKGEKVDAFGNVVVEGDSDIGVFTDEGASEVSDAEVEDGV
jgi:hypothetical protein